MGWVVNATPRPLYPRERPGIHCTGGWVGTTVGLDGCGKSRPPTGIRSPDHPARSEAAIPTELYRPRVSMQRPEGKRSFMIQKKIGIILKCILDRTE